MNLGNLARVLLVAGACIAGVGSATSNSTPPPQQAANAPSSPPPAQEMDSARALGLWRSTFGAVKIEADNAHGGLQAGSLQGIWEYQRQGQDVIGYFYGTLQGNVLKFHWQEPNNPPLTGEGYLVFEQTGRQYSGRWWSDKRDRVGDWNGWRQTGNQQPDYYGGEQQQGQGQYGGQQYGYPRPQQPPYGQQYPQQPQGQQPYYPQGQPQQYPPQQPQQYPQQPYYPQQQPQQYPPQQQPQQYPPQQPQQYPQQPVQQQPAQQPQQPRYY
ncbi:MAG: hypothetical protein QM831_05580 [Kofleriaceae bacterium]